MKINLEPYTCPAEYAGIYDHNLSEVDRIKDDDLFRGFIAELASVSGVAPEVVLKSCQDYLMSCNEYQPQALRPSIVNWLALPHFIVVGIKGVFSRKYGPADVIVDTWYPGAAKTFYTAELEAGFPKEYRVLFIDVNVLKYVDPLDMLRCLGPFVMALGRCSRILKGHGLDLRRYVGTFFKRQLIGRAIARTIKPRLIVSGNDNCFPFLIAKVARAEIMLIQNGKRFPHSLIAFKFVDYYVGWADVPYMVSKGVIKQYIKNYYKFGSIFLYGFGRSKSFQEDIMYDIVWVSTWDSKDNTDASWPQWDDYSGRCAAVEIFNTFARKSGLRIAFQCRSEKDVQNLEEAGLKVDNIKYITSKMQSVYTTVSQSTLVLSPMSSVVYEAMALGKRVGFVNMSGNSYMNLFVRHLNIEFNPLTQESFESFVARITKTSLDYSEYFPQNKNYMPDLLQLIQKIVPAGSNGVVR